MIIVMTGWIDDGGRTNAEAMSVVENSTHSRVAYMGAAECSRQDEAGFEAF